MPPLSPRPNEPAEQLAWNKKILDDIDKLEAPYGEDDWPFAPHPTDSTIRLDSY
jgi:hypothetical protein